MIAQAKKHKFVITPASEEDSQGVGVAHLQSWRETYPNKKLGIDIDWVNETVGFLAEDRGRDYRRNTIRRSHAFPEKILYLVAKTKQGKIVGFLHVEKTDDTALFEAIYLLQEAQGTGLADDLMHRALEFAGNKPMSLEVASYNPRAIRYYHKYGFEEVPGSSHIVRDKVPVFTMIRQPNREETDEV